MNDNQDALLALADRIQEADTKPIAIDPAAATEIRRLHAENEALKAYAARYRWLVTHLLWRVSYRIKRDKNGRDYREYRMMDMSDYWGQWWPTPEQAIDEAMKVYA